MTTFTARFHVTTMNTEGWTDLHHAAYGGHREVVEELISAGADVNARNGSDRTPLHAAAHGNKPGVVEMLLVAGADVDARGEFGQTPLHVAAGLGLGARCRRLDCGRRGR